jgi:pre-mRNA-splicing factor CWC26
MASAEYLQRYLSTGASHTTSSDYAHKANKEKKHKKKSHKSSKGDKSSEAARVKRVSNMQIVDDDVNAADAFLAHVNRGDDALAMDADDAALAQILANDPNRVLDDGPAVVDASELRGRVDFGDRPVRAPAGTFVSVSAARATRHDSVSSSRDESPPRRRQRHDSDSEKSAAGDDSSRDLSPPRRPMVDADGDVSPPRRRVDSSSSSSSSSSGGGGGGAAAMKPSIDAASLAHKSADEVQFAALEARKIKARMSSGASAGLQTASELKADMERVRREEQERFAQLDAGALGRDAAVVVRDRKGRVVDREAQAAARAEKEASKPQANKDWSRGLTQLAESKRDAELLAKERTSKFARSREDLDADQRKRKRWGDPAVSAAPVDGDNVKKREKSMIAKAMEATNLDAQQTYNGAWPPNRFDIPPGAHWDGVDRSNGFEKKCFARAAAKEASKVEKYHRSVSEM